MPKIAAGVNGSDFFNLNGLDFGKNQYQLVYTGIEVDANGDPDLTKVQVGLFSKYQQRFLVQPTLFSDWTNSSDVRYTSYNALLTDLHSLVGFESGGGGAAGTLQTVTDAGNTTTNNIITQAMTSSGTRAGANLVVAIGDYDNTNNNTEIRITDSTETIQLKNDNGVAIQINPNDYYGNEIQIINSYYGNGIKVAPGNGGETQVLGILTGNATWSNTGNVQGASLRVGGAGGGLLAATTSDLVATPTSTTDSTIGSIICWDTNYLYVDTSLASGTRNWLRVALSAIP